jgi:nicotinate-nucleotide pyrophosphorylase (carboxylating)
MFDLDSLIQAALKEDIGWGDVTTDSCVPLETQVSGAFVAKEPLAVCGLFLLPKVFDALGGGVTVTPICEEGDFLLSGTVIAEVSGPARIILTGERTALNLLQRLSGIATRTREAVLAVEGTGAVICDTRKTTPGLRVLEKYAVRTGGGTNHRMGLSDGVLIKDNHIAAAGGIFPAVAAAGRNVPHTLKIEVEVSSLNQAREALEAGADILMFDNMPLPLMEEAVQLVGGRAVTEASGNMGNKSLEELRQVAMTGVNLISIGGLTNSSAAADISLKLTGGLACLPF